MKVKFDKNIAINIVGNIINVIFIAVYVPIIAKFMPKADYGILMSLFNVVYVLANAFEMGITASLYRSIPKYLDEENGKGNHDMYSFVKSNFIYQALGASSLALFVLISFPLINDWFLHSSAQFFPFFIAVLGALMFIWQNFALNCLYASKKIMEANIYLNLSNFFRAVFIFALYPFGLFTINNVLIMFCLIGPILFFVVLFFVKKRFIYKLIFAPIKRSHLELNYAWSNFLAMVLLNIGTRIDLMILWYFIKQGQDYDVAEYTSAQKIILTFVAVIVSITQVLSPAFYKATTKTKALKELIHSSKYLMLPAIGFLVLMFIPDELYKLYFTDQFTQVRLLSSLMAIGYIIHTFSHLGILFLFYTVKKPNYVLIAHLIFLILTALGSFILIPTRGFYGGLHGGAIAMTIAFAVTTVILFAMSYKEFKKLPND